MNDVVRFDDFGWGRVGRGAPWVGGVRALVAGALTSLDGSEARPTIFSRTLVVPAANKTKISGARTLQHGGVAKIYGSDDAGKRGEVLPVR